MAFSGGTLVERDRVIALYAGIGIGKPNPRIPGLPAAMMVATSSELYYGAVGSLDPYYADTSVKPDRFKLEALQKWYGVGGMAPMETLDIQGS